MQWMKRRLTRFRNGLRMSVQIESNAKGVADGFALTAAGEAPPGTNDSLDSQSLHWDQIGKEPRLDESL